MGRPDVSVPKRRTVKSGIGSPFVTRRVAGVPLRRSKGEGEADAETQGWTEQNCDGGTGTGWFLRALSSADCAEANSRAAS